MTDSNSPRNTKTDICIIGGAGHVGLPLAILFATKGLHTLVYDINSEAINGIRNGRMPFIERGAEPLLQQALLQRTLSFSTEARCIKGVPNLIITIGTPVDEFLNPSLKVMTRCLDQLMPFLSDGQLIVLRSTIYPGVTESVSRYLSLGRKAVRIAFCPERIAEGHAIEELQLLPQIVSGCTPDAEDGAASLFGVIAPKIVRLSPLEAELVKLFANAYRYIQFAVANQFYMISSSAGVDYYRVIRGLKQDYPRARDIPSAGFAAGPCLFKDTMQLASFFRNQFGIGFQAMLVNEGLPQFIVDRLSLVAPLQDLVVGILGMAFKAESDDARHSLSYKLKKLLQFRAKAVLTTDPYVKTDDALLPLDEVLRRSDVLILATPHAQYRDVRNSDKIVIDVWNLWGYGGLTKSCASGQ